MTDVSTTWVVVIFRVKWRVFIELFDLCDRLGESSLQVVETSVTNNSLPEDYSHPDDHTRQTTDTPGSKSLRGSLVYMPYSYDWIYIYERIKIITICLNTWTTQLYLFFIRDVCCTHKMVNTRLVENTCKASPERDTFATYDYQLRWEVNSFEYKVVAAMSPTARIQQLKLLQKPVLHLFKALKNQIFLTTRKLGNRLFFWAQVGEERLAAILPTALILPPKLLSQFREI